MINVVFAVNGQFQEGFDPDKYTKIELGTFYTELGPDGPSITPWGLIGPDDIPVDRLPHLGDMVSLHEKMLENFQKKNWDFTEQAIEHLREFFPTEYNDFYDYILEQLALLRANPPTDPNWVPYYGADFGDNNGNEG